MKMQKKIQHTKSAQLRRMWKTVGELHEHMQCDVFAAKDKKPVDIKHEMCAYACGFSSNVG